MEASDGRPNSMASALARVAALAQQDLDLPVSSLRLGEHTFDVDQRPAVMAALNLSLSSTYRSSVVFDRADLLRRAQTATIEGAAMIDIGVQSTSAGAARVDEDEQRTALTSATADLVAAGIAVSVETGDPQTARAVLERGAALINLTSGNRDEEMFAEVAAAGAAILICYTPNSDVYEIPDIPLGEALRADQLQQLRSRSQRANELGVDSIALDPGIGFSFGNLTTADERLRFQIEALQNTWQLRTLGLPICQSLPHGISVFREQFLAAEAHFAWLAVMGGAGILRSHEPAQLRPVLDLMAMAAGAD